MKKVICLFSLVLLLFIAIPSFAQIKFGVKAGTNFAKMLIKDEGGTDGGVTIGDYYKTILGLHFGITTEFPISDKISLEPALLFSTKGCISLIANKVNLYYLELPINTVYKIDFEQICLLFYAGPYVGYALSGNKLKIVTFAEMNSTIKPIDFGINLGAGVGISSFIFNIQYGLGLANLTPNTTNFASTLKNRVIGLSVGYKFSNNSNSYRKNRGTIRKGRKKRDKEEEEDTVPQILEFE